MTENENDDDEDDMDNSSEKSDEDDATAVAEDDDTPVADGDDVAAVAVDDSCEQIVPLSSSQADKVHQTKAAIAALQSSIECLEQIGQLRMVQCCEAEISKLRRRERILASEFPAVAETFRRYRLADEDFEQKQLMIKQMNKRKKIAIDATLPQM